eukprot:m.786891 g.786891  ORF g.786891 m.786891 type:complete len:510 (-) comp23306_c0_seq18:1066-2595(-)
MGRLHELARNSSKLDVFNKLVGSGDTIDEPDAMRNTPLHYAARHGNYVIADALLNGGAELELKNKKGQTALYQAVVGQHGDIVQLLLDRGADAKTINGSGYAPVHYAARNGLTGILKKLLVAGADIDALTEEGHNAEYLATENKQEYALSILQTFRSTGSYQGAVDPQSLDEDDAALMMELDQLEIKPEPISAGPVLAQTPVKPKPGMTSPKEEDSPDGFGKVYLGKAPPPHMMNHITGGKRMAYDPSADPVKGGATGGAPSPEKMRHVTAPAQAPISTPAPPVADPVGAPKEEIIYNSVDEVLPSGAKVPPKAEPVYSKVDKKGVPVAVILSVANTAAAGGGVPEMMTENAMPTRRPHVPRPGTQSMGESSGSDPGVPAVVAAGNDTYDNSEANTVVCEEVSVWDNPIAPPEALYAEVDDVVADNLPPVPGAPRFHPQRASLTDMAATAMHAFLLRLALPESCAVLAEEAGIDEPDDFAMFTEDELVTNHGFKVGHVRKILRALANGE